VIPSFGSRLPPQEHEKHGFFPAGASGLPPDGAMRGREEVIGGDGLRHGALSGFCRPSGARGFLGA
jgi:hypothetical protein